MEIEAKVFSKICFKKYDKVREILKENKIDPSYMESGKTIMHLIAKTLEVDIAKMLLDMGVDVDIRDDWGNTPLLEALYEFGDEGFEDDSMIRLLLKYGAKKNTVNNYGKGVAEYLAKIKRILTKKEPEKLEKLDWLNIE